MVGVMLPGPTKYDLDDEEVTRRLVAAISTQAVAITAQELLALRQDALSDRARALAHAAVDTTARLSQQMLDTRAVLVQKMRDAGIKASGITGPEDIGHLQYHKCMIGIAPDSLEQAVNVAKAAGYLSPIALDRGRLNVLRRTADTVTLVHFDTASTRVVLRLEGHKPSRLPRKLRPALADLGAAQLPQALWPLYYLMRPLRIMSERLTRRRRPNADSDMLGTPYSIIAPLLDQLSLGATDLLVDLGCGDGRIVAEAAQNYGCRARGVESNHQLVTLARARLREAGLDPAQASIVDGSIEAADLSDATVIFMFLPSYLLAQFLPAVLGKVGPDVRIVTHEQAPSPLSGAPELSVPIFGQDGITIAHFWRGNARK